MRDVKQDADHFLGVVFELLKRGLILVMVVWSFWIIVTIVAVFLFFYLGGAPWAENLTSR